MSAENPVAEWGLCSSASVGSGSISISSVVHVPYSSLTVCGDSVGTVHAFDLATMTETGSLGVTTKDPTKERNIRSIAQGRLDANLVIGCESDKIFGWDVREPRLSFEMTINDDDEAWDISASPWQPVAACGQTTGIGIWDLRTQTCTRVLEDFHSDIVNRVLYHPHKMHHILSGSLDGIINVIDTSLLLPSRKKFTTRRHSSRRQQSSSSSGSEDSTGDALLSTFNTEDLVTTLTLGGPNGNILTSVSDVGNVALWDLNTMDRLVNLDKLRMHDFSLQNAPQTTVKPSFIVDSFFHEATGRMFVVGGTPDGTVALLHVNVSNGAELAKVLRGGHTDLVRVAASVPTVGCLTGGDDGKLCLWGVSGGDCARSTELPNPKRKHKSKK